MTVEVEFTSGTWTDISGYVDWNVGANIRQGRASEFDTIGPATFTATLQNVPSSSTGFSPFTPDSPVSPYFPNVTKGRRVRFIVYRGATGYQRFIGWIQTWALNLGESVGSGTVIITAVDRLGIQGQRTLSAYWAEWATWRIYPALPGYLSDAWPLDDASTSTSYRNISTTGVPLVVIESAGRTGSSSLIQSPDGAFVDGAVSLSHDSSSARYGPYLWAVPQSWTVASYKQLMVMFRTTDTSAQILLTLYNTASTSRMAGVARVWLTSAGLLQW